ncbi:serine/threonine protein kinase [Pseudoalteromonas fenneropenaei]|uniref:Stress response kinase A n=1 Tax=Pseudoalteromonas fenneropenaei TaxID=1737459 RepID=A0ABV7CQH9_9GAMM
MSDFCFAHLTPECILDAIESTGIYPESGLLPLNSYENRVFQFRADDNQRYVVKFYRPARWSEAQILEEHTFMAQLAAADIAVVAPLSINGKTLHQHMGFGFALFPSVGGRSFEVDNLDNLELLGQVLGRLHSQGAQSAFTHRPALNLSTHLQQPTQILQQSGLVKAPYQQQFFQIVKEITEICGSLYQPKAQIRLHGDCHAGNILATTDGLCLVDFDDCRQGPAIQDLWMMLSGDTQSRQVQLDALLSGYELYRAFDLKELALIEPLRAMRMIHYMAWLAERHQDPAFVGNFSWFATDKYWEQQLGYLQEQLLALQAPPLSLAFG